MFVNLTSSYLFLTVIPPQNFHTDSLIMASEIRGWIASDGLMGSTAKVVLKSRVILVG